MKQVAIFSVPYRHLPLRQKETEHVEREKDSFAFLALSHHNPSSKKDCCESNYFEIIIKAQQLHRGSKTYSTIYL